METATIHPIDFSLMGGSGLFGFGQGPGPHILGTEGSGQVIASGPGKGQSFVGRRVTIMPARPGAWTDLAVIHVNDAIILPDSTPPEVAATAMMSPLAALMFLDLARRVSSKAVLNTAANSTVGRMTSKLLQSQGIEVINLVRKPEKMAQLTTEGARNVVNANDANLGKIVSELCQKLQVNLVLDCVGGDFLTKLISMVPGGSSVCVYGNMASNPFSTISYADMMQGKILMAANVFSFWGRLNNDDKIKQVDIIHRELNSAFKTNIIKTFPFLEINQALNFYTENKKGASQDGKIILKW
jgi:NADPH:quinone reductase-like Zn-dependent oxidoreductase